MVRFAQAWIAVTTILSRLNRWVVSILISVILVSIVTQAINRYFNLFDFNAFDQIARLAMVWAVMLALVHVFAQRTNVRVDLLDTVMGHRINHLRNILADVTGATLMGLIHYKSWALISIGTTLQITGTPFTAAYTYSAIATGTLLLFLLFACRAVIEIAGLVEETKATAADEEGADR